MTRVYLCGPMTGKPNFNIPAFDAAATDLRERGYEVVSPAELDDPEFRELCLMCPGGSTDELNRHCLYAGVDSSSWGDLLARDVKLIADDGIEAIVAMEGWGRSRGACLETFVGRLSGLPILSYPTLRPIAEDVLGAIHGRACVRKAPVVIEDYSEEAKEEALREFPPLTMAPLLGTTPAEYFEQARKTEAGETRVVNEKTGGAKGSKLERFDLLPWGELSEVARLYGKGAVKYSPRNWELGYDWGLSIASLVRHFVAWQTGERFDYETNCHHLASVIFHALALMYFEKHHPELDDRGTSAVPSP